MPRIINKSKTYRIELGEDEYIDVRDQLSFKEFSDLTEKNNDNRMVFDLLKMIIVDWNILDEDGIAVPFKTELIEDFNIDTATECLRKAMERYVPDKKKVQQLTESSSTTQEEKLLDITPS